MKRKIALGPGAASLILIVVILSLCMLSMLMQIGSRNDLSLATRGTEMITNVYGLFSDSENRLAELDTFLVRCQKLAKDDASYRKLVKENLPEGFGYDDGSEITEEEVENTAETTSDILISWQEPLDRRVLTCKVKLLPYGEAERTRWVSHTFEEPSRQTSEEGITDD